MVAAIHPSYTAAIREFEAAGRTIGGSAPVGHDGTAAWLAAIGEATAFQPTVSPRRRTRSCPRSRARLASVPINLPECKEITKCRVTKGSELLVARTADIRKLAH